MTSPADEEAHQLSYLQKHIENIISLLAEPVEGEGDESLVLSMESYEHIGFLIHGDKGSDVSSLNQGSLFFANSDPDKPAVPVPASQVQDWLLKNIASALEAISDRISGKENGPSNVFDQDAAFSDASAALNKDSSNDRGPCIIEGVSKTSLFKQTSDLKGRYVKVVNCHDSVIYLLAPLRYATVYGCSDSTIVLGAAGKVAPYNTFYSHLEEHLTEVGIVPTINKWNEPLVLGAVDTHESLSPHPTSAADKQPDSAACVDSDQFTNFLIPNWLAGEVLGSTKANPFPLPDAYMAVQQTSLKNLEETRRSLRETSREENRKRELTTAFHMHFKDWLALRNGKYSATLLCLQGD